MFVTPITIPVQYQQQLSGFEGLTHCYLFSAPHFQPSYWLLLKREGFGGNIIGNSSELSRLLGQLSESELGQLYRLYHGQEPDHWFRFTLEDDVEQLILSQRIRVYMLEKQCRSRLENPNDPLYAASGPLPTDNLVPLVQQRHQLANALGHELLLRWYSKEGQDQFHWDSSFLMREFIEAGDLVVEAVDTVGDLIIGIKDAGVFVINLAAEGARAHLQLQQNAFELLMHAYRGDTQALVSEFRQYGLQVQNALDNARAFRATLEEGARILETLLSDPDTRQLLWDYLDGLYQSIPYRNTRTSFARVTFEVGLEVLLALATGGIAFVARRAAQAGKFSRATSAAKRIGPFTREAINHMLALARQLRHRQTGGDTSPPRELDIPEYAQQNRASDRGSESESNEESNHSTQNSNANLNTPIEEKNVFHATTNPLAAQGVIDGVDPKFLNPNSRFGAAFYVGENPGTTVAELAHHGALPTHGIRFNFNSRKANILDLTDPDIAREWNYSGGPISSTTQEIGNKASEQGYNVIRYYSERDSGGINNAILDNFNEILTPEFVSPEKP